MNYLILHGYGGKGRDSWQSHLARMLEAKGHNVLYPDLPGAEEPDRDEWIAALERELQRVNADDLTVACHSLGCSLWQHLIAKNPHIIPRRALLVAPPLTDCGIEDIKTFFPLLPVDWARHKDRYLLIGSDNDPFIPKEHFIALSDQLGIPFHFIPGAGHINTATGFGRWEWMEKQALNN